MTTTVHFTKNTGSSRQFIAGSFDAQIDLTPEFTLFEPLNEITVNIGSTESLLSYHILVFCKKHARNLQTILDTATIACGDWRIEMQYVSVYVTERPFYVGFDVNALVQDTKFYYKNELHTWNLANIHEKRRRQMETAMHGITR